MCNYLGYMSEVQKVTGAKIWTSYMTKNGDPIAAVLSCRYRLVHKIPLNNIFWFEGLALGIQ